MKQFEFGQEYSATGTCGMTDGIEVKGILQEVDGSSAIIVCDKKIPHLCNANTLTKL